MRSRATAIVATLGLLTSAAVVLAPAPPAGAQTAAPRLTLVAQDAWAPLGGDLHLTVEGQNLDAGLTLRLTPHARIQARSVFDQTLSGTGLGSSRNWAVNIPFDDLPRAADNPNRRSVAVGLASNGFNASRLDIPDTGVYPLEVEVRTTRDVVAGFVTYVVAAGTGDGTIVGARPLDVAWVLPLGADPAYLADGSPDPNVVADLRAAGRLGRTVDALTATGIPVTLAPIPETLEAWDNMGRQQPELAAGALAAKALVPRVQVLAGPYVQLDLPSILAGGLGHVVTDELNQGTDTLRRFFGTRIDTGTALPGNLDAASLTRLTDRGVDQVVIDAGLLVAAPPISTTRSPANPFLLQASGTEPPVKAVAPDPVLNRLLDGDDTPALRAMRLLAGLSFIFAEAPNDTRGIVVSAPPRWNPPREFLDALAAGLTANPTLAPVTVDRLFADVPLASTTPRQLAPVATQIAPPVTAQKYTEGQQRQADARGLFAPTDERVQRGARALLVVPSVAWATDTGRARARGELDAIGKTVVDYLSRIVIPAGTTITITSSRAEIPISFRNDTRQYVGVHIRLESDKLLFPLGGDRDVVLPPRNHTERFTVETRTSGTFPLKLTVTTTSGLVIEQTRLKLRSTFVSGVGLVVTVGAGAFLALWWGNDIRRRRRRARTDVVAEPV